MIDPLRAAVVLYQENWTTRQIGTALAVDSRTVCRWLRQRDVPTRRRGPAGRTDVSDDTIRRLIEVEQCSYASAAKIVDMSKSGVRQRYWRMIGRPRADR